MKLPIEFEELKVIGARIRQERRRRNLDQAALGKLAGSINKETMGRLETGRNSTLETLCAVCRALDLELAELLADDVPALGLPLSKKHSRLHSRFQAILDAGNPWEECITKCECNLQGASGNAGFSTGSRSKETEGRGTPSIERGSCWKE